MKKQKLKIGDHVKIINPVTTALWARGMTGTIKLLEPRPVYPVIVITTDGKTVTATKREGKKVISEGTACCAESDAFDLQIGTALALARCMGANAVTVNKNGKSTTYDSKPKPKYFTGKVVCVKTMYPWWTVGRVYEVVDGIITADDGAKYPKNRQEPYKDTADIRHAGCRNNSKHNTDNTFIPLVE